MSRQPHRHLGFTLVEILVAVTVLSILAGMLVVGLFPMMNRAKEMAITVEMKNIEQGIEMFKSKYGFYPPSFKQFYGPTMTSDVQRVALMRQYINRISPNHSEDVATWWNTVGQHIDYRRGEDLVFWLTGLFKNKQYPLTRDNLIRPAFGVVPSDNNFTQSAMVAADDRDIFYDFKSERLSWDPARQLVVSYHQDTDFQPGSTNFFYVDSFSYSLFAANEKFGPWFKTTPAGIEFMNARSFQLTAPGLDKKYSEANATERPGGLNVKQLPLADYDNITNFAEGRLSAYADSLPD